MRLKGLAASSGKIKGQVYKADDLGSNPDQMKEGDLLLIKFATPSYYRYYLKAGGVVTETGGITCHAACLARDMGIPCVVGVEKAIDLIKSGDVITIDGDEGVIYDG